MSNLTPSSPDDCQHEAHKPLDPGRAPLRRSPGMAIKVSAHKRFFSMPPQGKCRRTRLSPLPPMMQGTKMSVAPNGCREICESRFNTIARNDLKSKRLEHGDIQFAWAGRVERVFARWSSCAKTPGCRVEGAMNNVHHQATMKDISTEATHVPRAMRLDGRPPRWRAVTWTALWHARMLQGRFPTCFSVAGFPRKPLGLQDVSSLPISHREAPRAEMPMNAEIPPRMVPDPGMDASDRPTLGERRAVEHVPMRGQARHDGSRAKTTKKYCEHAWRAGVDPRQQPVPLQVLPRMHVGVASCTPVVLTARQRRAVLCHGCVRSVWWSRKRLCLVVWSASTMFAGARPEHGVLCVRCGGARSVVWVAPCPRKRQWG